MRLVETHRALENRRYSNDEGQVCLVDEVSPGVVEVGTEILHSLLLAAGWELLDSEPDAPWPEGGRWWPSSEWLATLTPRQRELFDDWHIS